MHRWTARAAGGISHRLKPGLRDDALAGQEAGNSHGRPPGPGTGPGSVRARSCVSRTMPGERTTPSVQPARSTPDCDGCATGPRRRRSGRPGGAGLGSAHGRTRCRASSPAAREPPSVSRRSSSPTRGRVRRSSTSQACGVCHTDLHYREGGINDDFPFLLGHEAAGVVVRGRRGRDRRRRRRLRGPELARGLRHLPGLRQGQAAVLLRHPQRRPEDDAGRRHRAVRGAGHRRVRGEDAGARRAVHQGRPGRLARPRSACWAAA